MKPDSKEEKNEYETISEGLENTVVYKLDELRSYKISPIRKKEKVELVDDSAIKDVLENTTQLSRKALEEELSKTQYLKDLKKKIEEAEDREEALEAKEVEKAIKKAEKEAEKAAEKEKVEEVKIEEVKALKKEPKEETKEVATKSKAKKKPSSKKANTHASRRTKTYKKRS